MWPKSSLGLACVNVFPDVALRMVNNKDYRKPTLKMIEVASFWLYIPAIYLNMFLSS